MRRIGILGGSFDPIHRGHVDLGRAAEKALGLTRLLIMPSHAPPHRPQPVTSMFHRFAMAAIAAAGHPSWQVSDLELRHAGPSYTSETLARLHTEGYAAHELVFLTGADAFLRIETWHDYPALLDHAHFAIVSRDSMAAHMLRERLPALAPRMTTPGHAQWATPAIILIDAPTANVSSTAIRDRRALGRSIGDLVPEGVEEHIVRHGLYASADSDRRAGDDIGHPAAGRLHGQS